MCVYVCEFVYVCVCVCLLVSVWMLVCLLAQLSIFFIDICLGFPIG